MKYYSQDLYKIARSKLDNEYDICDALQETMLSAYTNLKKVKDVEYFKTWIIKILINKCNDIYRNKGNIKLYIDIKDTAYEYEEDSILNLESKLAFENIINILNEEDRTIITLYYNNDFSIKQISDLLNMNENTVKTRLSRSKNKIKEKFKWR